MADTIIGGRDEVDANKRQLAIALEYDTGKAQAPRIIASGKGAIAEQILNIAFANGIKVREDAELAEILSLLEIDTVIPLEAFAAVAEILAYVYRENAMASQRQKQAGIAGE